ncbi:MAG: electron transport complex subunit RsxC [Clostridia bacterium]|nr:electron transport complex subunit RsxC [Clostridia bacterium]
MAFSLHGVHLPHRKNTADTAAVAMETPKTVTLPMGMHIGAPAVPVVKVGDHVDVGTLVAEQNGAISSPVYASVSGTVKAIVEQLQVNGRKLPAVVIESDGANTPDPAIAPPTVTNQEELVEAIRKSGIVGLGGAGFPTYVKFKVDPAKVEALIINGAECEPYITSDSLTMTQRADEMADALRALETHLGIKKVIIGIENNKKSAIAKMKELANADPCVQVVTLPAVYPQGGEKVLVYHTTGKVIPAGKLPLDVGCIVVNCTTLACIGQYLKTGMPLVDKCITVDGSAVKEPKNVIVPIGTAMEEVFAFCGGFKEEPGKVLYGGPMMGVAVADLSAPVLKNTNAILAFDQKDAVAGKETACIRCGACYNHCPFGINPVALEKAYREGDAEAMEKAGADVCMECGCCAFICPANRPLVQNNKLAKVALRDARAAAKEKEDQK